MDITSQFLDEAKRLLDLETGRESLPTVQGLALLFTTSAFTGMDRAGSVYRYSAYQMLKRLRLEKRFAKLNDDDLSELRQKRAISKALWGLFCFDRYVEFVR
jgi:hypothetical protein